MLKTNFTQELPRSPMRKGGRWPVHCARSSRLAELMDTAREDVLACMTFPPEHWPQMASANPLERLDGEIKQRADVVAILPTDRSVIRLVEPLR